jgi:hypothetical protein
MHRGPGGNETTLILEHMKKGKSFDDAVAQVEMVHGFICEQWWKDLNRAVYEAEVKGSPAKAKDPLK